MAVDPESINFLDLACLFKISAETTLERFGTTINASVFDAANITGGLKQKGLIDFTAYYPGPNSIVVTDAGKKLKEDADAKGAEPIDGLDDEILRQMSGGKRYPVELGSTLNLRPKDLAFRLWKLSKQSMVSYELKNGTVELMLTEQGFLKARSGPAVQAPTTQMQPQAQAQAQGQVQTQPSAQQPQQAMQEQMEAAKETAATQGEIKLHGKPHTKQIIIGVIIAAGVAAFAIAAHFYFNLI